MSELFSYDLREVTLGEDLEGTGNFTVGADTPFVAAIVAGVAGGAVAGVVGAVVGKVLK